MRNILFFDHTASAGGGEIALLRLATALDRKRFNPVVVLGANGPLCRWLAAAKVETHVLPLAASAGARRKESIGAATLLNPGVVCGCWGYARRLVEFMRWRGIELLHTNSLKADVIGALAARGARVPLVWHVRDRIAPDYLPTTVATGFRTFCSVLPNRIIANSKATLETLGAAKERATVIYDGMPVEPRAKTTWIADRPPVIGLLGRISPWKGQDLFLRAAALVRQRFPEARFRIIGAPLFGEEAYERGLHRLVCDLGLEGAVEFTGFQEDVKEQLERLSVVAHASTVAEPLGQVVFEAMYYSRPVVAVNAGGVKEIIEENVTGLLFPMGDEKALADALVWLLANPELAREMGAAGHERVLSHFSISQTARAVEAVYNQLLQ